MKKSIFALIALISASFVPMTLTSCGNDQEDFSETYKEWREYNEKWMAEQSVRKNPDGTPYYTTVVAPWDPEAFILVRFIGERHPNNLKPLYTSTTTVNYELHHADDKLGDKNAGYRTVLNSPGLITGWGLSIMQMNVCDSAEFIIPYELAYGTGGNSIIKPYSNLRFNIRLVDINGYEVKP